MGSGREREGEVDTLLSVEPDRGLKGPWDHDLSQSQPPGCPTFVTYFSISSSIKSPPPPCHQWKWPGDLLTDRRYGMVPILLGLDYYKSLFSNKLLFNPMTFCAELQHVRQRQNCFLGVGGHLSLLLAHTVASKIPLGNSELQKIRFGNY